MSLGGVQLVRGSAGVFVQAVSREPLVLMLEWHVLLAHRSRPSKHRAPEDGTVVQQADGTAQRERDGSEGAQTSRRRRQGL